MLIPGSPEHVLSTLYEAKRRGLGGWPKPRGGGEFLEPLALPSSGGQQKEHPSSPRKIWPRVPVKAGETARGTPRKDIYCQGRGHPLPDREKRGHFPC